MRAVSICFFSVALLATPKGSFAQQDVKTESQKPAVDAETKPSGAQPSENWSVLDDLKSGLRPATVDVVQSDEQPDYVRELIRVQWRRADSINLWIIRPKVSGKVPVVLYLYNYTDDGERFHDDGWGKRAAAEGFAAVGFSSALSAPRFMGRPMKQWFVSELQESLGSSVHDVQLILNYLARRGDMDLDHVGMFGMGSGATIAILAAHTDARISALDLLDPWGDWPDWLKSSPVVPDTERAKCLSPEFLKTVATLDPVDYLPTLKTPSFRLQITLSDPATPDVARERLAKAVPEQAHLVKYASAEDLFKAWKTSGLAGWIKQQMRYQKPKEAAMQDEQRSTNVR
jgi:hypothetical protein